MKPIRVLQVVTNMDRGGIETMLMNYYRAIDREKIQFDFLVHRQEKSAYDDEIESLGGNIYRLPKLIPWGKKYNKALNDFFKHHSEYKVVHVHQDCLSSVVLRAAKNNGVPVRIAHSHNSSQNKGIKYIIKLYYRDKIPKFATDLFACGKVAGDWMFKGAEYTIIRNAIDAKKFSYSYSVGKRIRNEFKIAENAFVVGHVGGMSPQKNHKFLIDVFKEIHDANPDSVLLLVGDGPEKKNLKEQVRNLQLDDSCIFAGSRGNVSELMQAMDVFVMPSIFEGLPLVLVEAQSAGLKCFISDTIPDDCKITELVEYISLTKQKCEWAEIIMRNANPERHHTYEQIASAGFDIEMNAQRLQEFYINKWKDNE